MHSPLTKAGCFLASTVAGCFLLTALCPVNVFAQSEQITVLRGQTPIVTPSWSGQEANIQQVSGQTTQIQQGQVVYEQPVYTTAAGNQAYGSQVYADPAYAAPVCAGPACGNDVWAAGNNVSCASCNQCNYCMQGEGLFPCRMKRYGLFYVDGWLAAGGTSENQPPLTTGARSNLDDEIDSVQLNQLYLIMGREAKKGCNMSFGARADLLFGTDYLYTSSLGLESYNHNRFGAPVSTVYAAQPHWNQNARDGYSQYGLALPQAYAEVFAPIMCGLTVKMGHFYSPLGYESVMNPANFFYTHTYSMLYAEAKTLTGAIANLQMDKNWSAMAGFAQGWDVWEDNNNAMSWMAGAKWENDCKTSSLSFTIMSGDEVMDTTFSRGAYTGEYLNGNVTNYSLVYEQQLAPSLRYVLQHDLGVASDANRTYNMDTRSWDRVDGKWYSLVNYLYYQMSDTLAIGGRFEWFKDENHSRVMSTPVASPIGKFVGDNYFDASLGLNWKPTNWFTFRPEVRWDWSDVEYQDNNGNVVYPGVYSDFSKSSICTFSCDAIIKF